MNKNEPKPNGRPFILIGKLFKKRAAPPPPPPSVPPSPPTPKVEPEAAPPLVLVHVPDASAEIIDLEGEVHRLQEQQLTWPFNPPRPQQPKTEIPPLDENHYWEIARKIGRIGLVLVCVFLALLPPLFVFMERWLDDRGIRDVVRDSWCKSQFFCDMWWPSYFMIIIPVSLLVIALVVFVIRDNRPRFQSPAAPQPEAPQKAEIRPEQRRTVRVMEGIAAAWLAVVIFSAITTNSAPGIELLPVILIYLGARILAEYPAGTIMYSLGRWWLRFWPLGLAHLTLILFLATFNSGRPGALLTFVALAAALLNLWKHRAQVETIHWITLAAIFVFTIDINSWVYSAVGDEFSFFTFGRDILQYQTWDYRNTHLFNGMGVYGTHPYFSSIFHALSMGVLGVDNFGWRFSSLYLAAISIPMFYYFFRRFLDERVSLLGAGMLGCSHYLMTFGKVGYNNLQALFVMGLVLWLAGEAVRNRRRLNYTLFGLSLGLVFYVYPAAFYILPLAGVLLLMYDPPFNRGAILRWLLAGVAFLIFFCPLLFQPEYWQTKVAGTLFYNPDVVQQMGGVGAHLVRNSLYSLYSFLFMPQESHFVVSSFVDPLSGMLVLLGLAWVIKLTRRDRFAVYVMICFVLLNFFVGATHDRQTPPNTRMFLLLPWFTLFAAFGLSWLAWQMQRLQVPRRLATSLAVLLLLGVIVGNLYQAYTLSRHRNEGTPSMEMLFLRMLQREDGMPDVARKNYLFLTQENWNIDGLRLLQEIYGVPDSNAQMERVVVTDGNFSPYLEERIRDENVGVILQPWMEEELRTQVEERLAELEKKPCVIRDTPKTDTRFTIWWSAKWIDLCPANGDWSIRR